MNLVLYFDLRSPPVRSVLMLIKLLNIEVELIFIDLFKGEHLKPQFKALNPLHTLPTLVDADNDLILTDSHVILMHLCEVYGKDRPELWPTEYKPRLKVSNVLFFQAALIFRRDSDLMSEIIRKTFDGVDINYHRRRIHEMYCMCEAILKKQKYFATDYMTIADISAVATLSTIELMFPITAAQWPTLSTWLAVMKSLPEYEMNEKGLKKLKAAVEECGKFQFPSKDVN